MKVALIHMHMGWKGGLETRMYNYIDYFRQRGYEVTLITFRVAEDAPLPQDIEVLTIDVSNTPKHFRLWSFNKGLEKLMGNHSFDYALSMGRTYSQPYLIAPNTHKGFLQAKHQWWTAPTDWMQVALDRRSFNEAKQIFACSNMVKNEIIEMYGVPAAKVVTAYPPVNTEVYNPVRVEDKVITKNRFGLDPEKVTFLLVSTSHRRKGLDLLMQVFEQLVEEPVELAVAGTDLNSGLPHVRSLGFVKDMKALYQAVDFTIHPAVYEPFGQIVSESLCCGTPVIISENTGAKEVVGDQEGRVVKGFDVHAWLEAIKEVMNMEFTISPDFAQHKGLTLQQHMDLLLDDVPRE